MDTGFIEGQRNALINGDTLPDVALAVASLVLLQERRESAAAAAQTSNDQHSPWHEVSGWRLNGEARSLLAFQDAAGERREVMVHFRGSEFLLDLPGKQVAAGVARTEQGGVAINWVIGGSRLQWCAMVTSFRFSSSNVGGDCASSTLWLEQAKV